MKLSRNENVGRTEGKTYSTWSKEEIIQLLEFILMNPNRFQNGSY
jgi:hypothetical protein